MPMKHQMRKEHLKLTINVSDEKDRGVGGRNDEPQEDVDLDWWSKAGCKGKDGEGDWRQEERPLAAESGNVKVE